MQNPDNFQALNGEEPLTTQSNSTDVEYDELEEMLRADAPAGSEPAERTSAGNGNGLAWAPEAAVVAVISHGA